MWSYNHILTSIMCHKVIAMKIFIKWEEGCEVPNLSMEGEYKMRFLCQFEKVQIILDAPKKYSIIS